MVPFCSHPNAKAGSVLAGSVGWPQGPFTSTIILSWGKKKKLNPLAPSCMQSAPKSATFSMSEFEHKLEIVSSETSACDFFD